MRASYKQKYIGEPCPIFPDGALHREIVERIELIRLFNLFILSFVELVGTKVIRRLNVLWHSTPRSEHGTLRMVDQEVGMICICEFWYRKCLQWDHITIMMNDIRLYLNTCPMFLRSYMVVCNYRVVYCASEYNECYSLVPPPLVTHSAIILRKPWQQSQCWLGKAIAFCKIEPKTWLLNSANMMQHNTNTTSYMFIMLILLILNQFMYIIYAFVEIHLPPTSQAPHRWWMSMASSWTPGCVRIHQWEAGMGIQLPAGWIVTFDTSWSHVFSVYLIDVIDVLYLLVRCVMCRGEDDARWFLFHHGFGALVGLPARLR